MRLKSMFLFLLAGTAVISAKLLAESDPIYHIKYNDNKAATLKAKIPSGKLNQDAFYIPNFGKYVDENKPITLILKGTLKKTEEILNLIHEDPEKIQQIALVQLWDNNSDDRSFSINFRHKNNTINAQISKNGTGKTIETTKETEEIDPAAELIIQFNYIPEQFISIAVYQNNHLISQKIKPITYKRHPSMAALSIPIYFLEYELYIFDEEKTEEGFAVNLFRKD